MALFLALLVLFSGLPATAQNRMQGTAKSQYEGPRLLIKEREVDFGVVSRGTLLEHTFTVENIGSEPLTVLRAQTGCDCSVASYDEEIAPGESGTLDVVVDTSTLAGMIGKGVSITTNDRYMSTVQVVIRAIVLGSVEILPDNRAVLSNRSPDLKTHAFLVRQQPTEEGELLVQRATASVPWIAIDAERLTVRREAAEGLPRAFPGDWIVRVALTGDAPAGRTREEVRFGTGLQREPEITLDIAIDFHPPVSINLAEIRLAAGKPMILLASLREDLASQPLRMSASDGLSVRTEPGPGQRSSRFFKIHLAWNGEPPATPVEFHVEVGKESRTFEVHVSADE